MTKETRNRLLATLAPIIIALIGAISGYAVNSYRVTEQATQIKVLQDTTVKRTEMEDLQRRLDRIEGKIDRTDEHILQHIQSSIPNRR